jgi:S-adenosylmethionine hydrolase
MIALITDYGLDGLYVGQMRALLAAALPTVQVIDLCHTIPAQDIRSAAYLIPAYTQYLPPSSIIICVVDPGVGGDRPHAVCKSDAHWYIGPDNGIFDVLQQHSQAFKKYHFTWSGEVSNSFHGRDIYSPAACLLAESGALDVLQTCQVVTENFKFKPDIYKIIYFDTFGNAITGLRYSSLPEHAFIRINGQILPWAHTFSEVELGHCFSYENANGLVELSCNQGSVKDVLGLNLGDSFSIE